MVTLSMTSWSPNIRGNGDFSGGNRVTSRTFPAAARFSKRAGNISTSPRTAKVIESIERHVWRIYSVVHYTHTHSRTYTSVSLPAARKYRKESAERDLGKYLLISYQEPSRHVARLIPYCFVEVPFLEAG